VRVSHLLTGAVAAVAVAAATATAVTTATGASPARAIPAARLRPAPPPVRYVALGDSYTAGALGGDGRPGQAGCARSADAFPALWARRHAPASFTSVACAGATTWGVARQQVSALSAGTTLVSLTVGGDDAGFSHVMQTCVLKLWNSGCLDAVASAGAFITSTLPGRLDATLRAIRARAPSARIVVLGYPDLYDLSRSAGCIGLSGAKRAALDRGAGLLDRALSAAAARNGDVFADVQPHFAGHEICDPGSWLHAVTFPLGDSYHPTAAGQERGYLRAFTAAAGR